MTFSTVMRHFARALPRARKKGVRPEPAMSLRMLSEKTLKLHKKSAHARKS